MGKAEVKVEKKNVDKKFKMEVDHNKLDKMFAACKGLVIHRGSKYGLNSRSKMARLAEQEMKQNILKAEKNIKKEKIKVVEDVKVEAVSEKKKKKSKKCKKEKKQKNKTYAETVDKKASEGVEENAANVES